MLNNILGMIAMNNPQYRDAYQTVLKIYKDTGGKLTNSQVSSIMKQYNIDDAKLSSIKNEMSKFGINM